MGASHPTSSGKESPSAKLALDRSPLLLAAVTVAIAVGDLLGWWRGLSPWTRWVPSRPAMVPTTAIALAALGTGIACASRARAGSRACRWTTLALVAFVLSIAGATVVAYAVGSAAGPERLFLHELTEASAQYRGRMSPQTAVALACLAVSLGLMVTRPPHPRAAQALGVVTATLATVALGGHVHGATVLFGLTNTAGVALPTAIALLALAAGIATLEGGFGLRTLFLRPGPAGRHARLLAGAALVVPFGSALLLRGGEVMGWYDASFRAGAYLAVMVLLLSAVVWAATVSLFRAEDEQESLAAERAGRELAEAVAQALRRYELLAGQSRDVVLFMRRQDGRILEANDAAVSLYGYRREELLGLSVADLRVPGSARLTEEQMREADEAGILFETVHRAKDGRSFPVEVSSRGATVEGTRTLISIVRDITDRQRGEKALRESEERFRTMADAIPQLAWIARPDGSITWYNRRWYEYTGRTPEEMQGWGWQSVHDEATLPDVLQRWKESIATGTAFEMEFPLRGADGRFRSFLTRVHPVKDGSGHVLQWVGTNTDVTELVEAQEALRAANRLKDDFLSMASHELRTPLTALRLQTETLSRSLHKAHLADEKTQRRLSLIHSQIDRMEELVKTLLDVSRIEAGRLTLDLAEFDLAELAREVVERFESQAEKDESELRFRAREARGRWDRSRLDQVITNVVSNALKYGAGKPVEVTVGAGGAEATVEVRDHGIGIAAESHERIFERFERAANTRPVAGLGLGLWITKRLVTAHGGHIALESSLGEGATFTITLPRSSP